MKPSIEVAMGNFPQDVLLDIFSWLPVKSLCRFRCVSKPWCSLIYGPHLTKMHLQKASQSTRFQKIMLISRSSVQSMDSEALADTWNGVHIDHPWQGLDTGIYILGSCNGMLFINLDSKCLLLWNPSTSIYKAIPKPEVCLEYFSLYGFGYDSITDDYKMVRIIRNFITFGSEIRVNVFSLRTNRWRRIQNFDYDILFSQSGALVNGTIHWVVGKQYGIRFRVAIAFDLAEEKFQEVPLPDFGERDVTLSHMTVLQNSLCMVCYDEEGDYEMWIMREYNVKESWTRFIAIPWGIGDHYLNPLCFITDSEVLMQMSPMAAMTYSLVDNTWSILVGDEMGTFNTVMYVESLVSPRAFDGVCRLQYRA